MAFLRTPFCVMVEITLPSPHSHTRLCICTPSLIVDPLVVASILSSLFALGYAEDVAGTLVVATFYAFSQSTTAMGEVVNGIFMVEMEYP